MKNKKKLIWMVSLLIIAIIIRVFSSNPLNTEYYYATGVYPYIASTLRAIFGWIPFSIGDLLYGTLAFWILWKLATDIKMLFKNQFTWLIFLKKSTETLIVFLIIYITFNILWGINYNRQGIATQLELKMDKYSPEELKTLNSILLKKVNDNKLASLRNDPTVLSSKEIFKRSEDAYVEVSKKYAFLHYQPASIKVSIWGWVGNYMGFNGYFNPFTGEAQVNTTIPKFLQPFVTCHEMAHQLGYAKEMEANFVGFLSATSSKDSLFLYSTYLDLFLYADRNLHDVDSTASKAFSKQLLPSIKQDILDLRAFNRSHESAAEPVIRWIYGKFLQSNQQPSGVLSYDEVTGFLIAYYKKFGKL